MTRPENEITCEKCQHRFRPSVEVENLCLFNEMRKDGWLQIRCPKCNLPIRIARFSKGSFVVHAEPEY